MSDILLNKIEVIDLCLTVVEKGTIRKSYKNALVDISTDIENKAMYITIEDNHGKLHYSATHKFTGATKEELNEAVAEYFVLKVNSSGDLPSSNKH